MSHTILYGLVKAWVDLVCRSGNGVVVKGVPFHLHGTFPKNKVEKKNPEKLIGRMARVMRSIHLTSAYNRDIKILPTGDEECVLPVHASVHIV